MFGGELTDQSLQKMVGDYQDIELPVLTGNWKRRICISLIAG